MVRYHHALQLVNKNMANDKSIALKGGLWTSVSTAVTVLTQFARLMILTRFLEKSDFGLVSIVNMVIGLCLTFTDLGFSSAIMYKRDITQKEYSTLFWMQLIIFGLLYLVLFGLSPVVANFYDEGQLRVLIPIASLTVIFQAFGKLYDTVLQKQYQFKVIAFRNITSNIISLIVGVLLAWKGFGVYSLIFSTLSYAVILNTWNFISGMRVQKVIFYCNPRSVIHLLKIGVFQTGTRILDFLSNKLDVMIIGKLLGTETLGLYDLAKNLVNTVVDLVRTVVSKVALPILSNNNDNDDAVRQRFLKMTKVVAYICIPLCIGIAVFSKEILWIVYGSSYIEASTIMSLFAFVAMFNSICSFYDMLGVAKGRTDLNFYNTVARILITTPIVVLTSLISIEIVAYGQLLATILQSIAFWLIVVNHTYPVSFKYYFSQFSKWLVIQLACFMIMYVIKPLVAITEMPVLSFMASVLIYAALLVIPTLLFMQEDITYFRNLIKR